MLSVKAIYDGKNVKLSEKVEVNKPVKVIVTFLNDEDSDFKNEKILIVADNGGSFDFLNDPTEDIYTDKDLKIKYK